MKQFDWTKAVFGQFLVKFSYIGTRYSGLAYTDEATCTIEREIFRALVKSKMIKSRETCNFSRCGRTDSGVHAAGNYLSLALRLGIDHVYVINKLLPTDIRFLAIRAVGADFNARFRCKKRTYKYFQPVWEGLDLVRMEEASLRLVGRHDFRNFCKMDVAATTNFVREIYTVSFKVDVFKSVVEIEVSGNGFLWHQIRCIVAILLLVAEGLEDASLISELLDIERNPRKPLYPLADPSGLVLFDCEFNEIEKFSSQETFEPLRAHRETLADHLRLAAVLQAINGLGTVECGSIPKWTDRKRMHKPIVTRARGPSLEEKVDALKRKRTETKSSIDQILVD